MERSPLLSPLQTTSSQLRSSRIHSTASSPGGVHHRSSSRSPPPTKPRSESHDRSYSTARKRYEQGRSQERDERNRPRDFANGDRRRPKNGSLPQLSSRITGPDGSPPSEMGFQESPRARYPDRFLPPRDPRFRSSPDTLKSSIDHSGASPSISRHFMSNSSSSSSNSLAHSREFGPTPSYKGSHIDNMNNRSLDYFSSIPTGPGGPGLGLGLGPSRYMDREEWRGRSGQFSRDLERDRDMRGRDGRDPRPRDPRDRTLFNRDERDPREGISTRDFRDRENRDRDARDRSNWSDPKNREGRNSRDGQELDIRELVELEREREKERERDRRERPIWIRESDRDHDGLSHNRSTDAFGRERDRHSIVQELDRDLLAYTSDKPHANVSSKSDDSISVDDRSEKSRDKDGSARANSDEPPHQPRAMEQERRSFGPNSHRSRSHERSFPNRDDRIYDGEEGRERDYERDYDRDYDRDRNSHIRSDPTNLRSDFDHRSNKGGYGKRQRILSAPMSEDIGYSETFGPRNRDYPSRSSYPASPATSLTHLNRDRLERFDRSDRYSLDETPPTQPRGRRSSDIPEHELYPRAERREHEPRSDRDRPRPREASPPHHTEAPRDRQDPPTEPNVHKPTTPTEPKAMASLPDINKRDRISTPPPLPPLPPPPPPPPPRPPVVVAVPSSQPEKMDEDVPIKQEVDSLGPPLEPPTLSHDGSSMYAQGTRSTNDKVARSPSTTSLPSPGLSPIHEPQVVVPKEAGYENHANILVEIDIIDGDIQKHEEMLREHRIKKEKKLASIAVEEIVVDEATPQTQEMEVEVDQSNATNDIEETMEAVLVEPAKDLHQLNGLEGEDVEMESVEPETVQVPKFSLQDIMKPVDEDDPFYKRKGQQTRRPQLFDQIYAENNSRAKKYGRVHLAIAPVRDSDQQDEEGRHHHHHHHHRHLNGKPEIFQSVEDYPFYQENVDRHARLRGAMLKNLAAKAAALDEKELNLKREYKQHWEVWTKKVEKLDKQKEKMSSTPAPINTREEDQVGESTVFTTRNRRGAYTSDAVRSEAELLEIIQSLENADMRNPDVRASRTAATVPPMILDPFVREHVHYYDYNHLVTDPAKYYRLGPVTDTWSEEEREIFIKRYLNHPKQFGKIAAGIEGKTASQCVLFYYREKKKIGFKDMLSNRGRKRKNNGGKRKEKAIQPPSPGQPGKKHKGSALIEDIGQANRTKQAKTKELRELQESNLVLKGFDIEPGSRRRVRSGVQQGGTPGEDTSNAASPAPSSTVSTPAISSTDRRKQKPKGNTRGSKTSAAAAAAAAASAVEEAPEKKPKVERSSPAVGGSTTKTTKQEEPLISVDSPGTTPTPSKVISEAEATEVTVTATSTSAASARWTGPEHEKAIDALKKYGRDFEAVAAAVGTKTVDQCRNFCFNYKRKFGVSALDDANNLRSTPNDDGDLKEGTAAEKSKTRKTKTGSASNIVDSSNIGATGKDVGNATTTGRKRTAKPALPVVPESEKDEPMLDVPESETVEDPDTVPKTRRKRTASRSEAGNADAAPSTGTSFRALYSREPPSASNSPALSSFSPTDSGQFSGSNIDGAAKRPNFSSYWSRQEKLDFVRLLNQYGKDWDQIAKALKTKTQIQVRNHFVNNEGKLVADGVIGIDVVGTSQDQGESGESGEQDTSRAPFRGSYAGHEYPPAQYAESMSEQSGGPGPRPGYFMPPSTINGVDTVPVQRETRSMTPPRRATNIGNLLNNNDEDVHVAVEDWFGNSEESGSQDAEDEVPEDRGQTSVNKPRDIPHDPRFNETRRRDMDEDVETEDEFDRPRAQEMQKTGVRGYPNIGQRRMSEGAPMSNHYPVNPSGPDYYGRHPQTMQHPQGTSVLGSPYGQQYYGPSHGGYGSPPLTVTAPPGNHAYQRMHSPPVPMSTAPSSIIVQPHSHHLPHQHQRSSSTSHGEMIPQSHPSPQMVSRARSPNHQGPYFGQHHYAHPPAPTPPGSYSQHHHSQSGQLEVLSPHPRPVGDTHMMHHSSLPTSSGHVPMSHSGPSRYSSSPQLPGSGSTMRGSPGAGNRSPAHLGHGSSRYSPAPVVSPMANEGSMHHLGQQQAYQHHHRRSSSPFQHHVPGHVPSPSYLHAPPHGVHSKPSSAALPYSSSHGAASLLPPPLPAAGPSSSDLSPGPSYHGNRSSQQYSPGYGHHSYQQPPQHHYAEHSGGSMPPSSSAMPHHAQRPHPSGPSYNHAPSSGRYTHGSTSS